MEEIPAQLNELSRRIIAAAMRVNTCIGPGFPENVYQRALSVALSQDRVRHTCEHPLRVTFEGSVVGEGRADLLVENQIIVELKAVEKLNALHAAQTLAYLRAADLRLGLLMNFHVVRMTDGIERILNPYASKRS